MAATVDRAPALLFADRGRRRLAALNPFGIARTRRQWVADGAVFVVGVVAWGWLIATQHRSWVVMPDWWVAVDITSGALATVALWWCRRYPVVVVAALAPVIGVVLSGGFAALVSIYSVAARRPMRIALLATVVHICLAAPYYFIFPVFDASFTTWVAFMLLLYLPALSLGLAARSRRQVIAGLVAAAERDRRSYEMRLDRARQIERSRIAREMHDVLAHRISLLSVHAGALEYRTRDGAGPLDAAELRAAVGVIRSSAHQALEDLTEVLDLLRPTTSNHTADDELSAGRPQPTIADVPRLAAEAEAAGQRVRLRLEVDAGELDRFRPQAQRTVFRVVQEGLTNARKHAPGAAVDVRVGRQPDGAVTVAVVNALPVGTTGSEIPGAGAGLTGLAERVEVEGGRLGTVVADGQFALSAEIPWRP